LSPAPESCVLIVVLVTGAALAARRRERRRGDRLRSWAQHHGWVVVEHPAVDWGRRLPGGNRAGVTVLLSTVVRGRRVSVAEYTVTDVQITSVPDGAGGTTPSTTTNTHHYTITVALLTRPMPDTTVEPRPKLSRLARAVTGTGETSTGDARFDRAFRIRTAEPAAIRFWCTRPLIDAHLHRRVPAWSVHGTELMAYHPGRLDPATIAQHADPVIYLAALLDPATPR
jgi:hypothetical protein